MTDEPSPRQPLQDVHVLDLSRLLPGPFCTMLLGDMGADIVKVEGPEGGDYARGFPPRVGDTSAFFASVNRNKRSMTLDLKHDRGAEVFEDLVAEADVLLESFRPGVMERLGFGPESVREEHPELVYCSITGYGRDGPERETAGHDLNYLARAGILDRNRRPDELPVVPGFQLADVAGGGLYSALGIVSALYGRTRTGEGATLDVSMTEGALSFHAPLQAALGAGGGGEGPGETMLEGGAAAYNVYETADGEYLAVSPLEPKFWMKLVDLVDAHELASEGLATGEAGEEAKEKLGELFRRRTRAEWLDLVEGHDVCCEPVRSPLEVVEDALFEARDVFFELAGVRHLRTPVTPADVEHVPPPGYGEHTSELLRETGRSDAQMEELREQGAI